MSAYAVIEKRTGNVVADDFEVEEDARIFVAASIRAGDEWALFHFDQAADGSEITELIDTWAMPRRHDPSTHDCRGGVPGDRFPDA